MAAPRPRSVFWIVSTHVITTSVYMVVILFGWSFLNAIIFRALSLELLTFVFAIALAVLFGIHGSLSYIRSTTVMRRPQVCTLAANATFGGFGAGLFLMILLSRVGNRVSLFITGVCIVGICCLFCTITRHHFLKMTQNNHESELRGFAVIPREVTQNSISNLPNKTTQPEVNDQLVGR